MRGSDRKTSDAYDAEGRAARPRDLRCHWRANLTRYCVQVDEIIRIDVTWMCCPADAAIEPADDTPPLAAVVPLEVVPGAPVVPVEPVPVEPVAPPPVEPEPLDPGADVSVPVTSTWCPLCCVSSASRPSRM